MSLVVAKVYLIVLDLLIYIEHMGIRREYLSKLSMGWGLTLVF